MTGATTAKGTMVIPRYRSTLGRAAARVALKKIDPARAMATSVSAPMASAWVSARRANGLCPIGRASRDWLILAF